MSKNDISPYNRLKNERSLYLRQHENDAVNWWSFSSEAFLHAEEENRPVMISVGYSSCHWCHVMAKESFLNEGPISKFLNEHFISIKVDKEEYPDLDQYYQQFAQLFSQTSGHPLILFLLPDGAPFFAGTYFPKEGLYQLLQEIHRVFTQEVHLAQENAQNALEAIEKGKKSFHKVEFQGDFPPPTAIVEALKEHQDEKNGGYGKAPKFPLFPFMTWNIEQILEGMIPKEPGRHAVFSLEKMFMGGIFDQIRGGLHRYSSDEMWLIPHFEKMLYDQAGVLKILSRTGLLYPSPLLFDALMNTLNFLSTEMLSEENYFFTAQDADSEGIEGSYYTFTEEEFDDAFKEAPEEIKNQVSTIKKWFYILPEGNFDNYLNVLALNEEFKNDYLSADGWKLIREARNLLLKERQKRIPPLTDTKGISGQNFMILSSLLDVIQYCRIETISRMASDLIEQTQKDIIKTFIEFNDQEELIVKHTNFPEQTLLYFENYVFFAEYLLRSFEIFGKKESKEQFKNVLEFIERNFIKDKTVYTRALTPEDGLHYPNEEVSIYDHSYQSPLGTYLLLLKRASALFLDENYNPENILDLEKNIHRSLRNPLSSGEALRAFSYPSDIMRRISVPENWCLQQKFRSFLPYFLPRFVIDYHEEKSEQWQICNKSSCEMQGEGLENFLSTLSPKQEEKKS